MFSINRLYGEVSCPKVKDILFGGRVSQGHSDAIRRVEGVVDGKQYTIPMEEAIKRVRNGEEPDLTNRERHLRECYVVAQEGQT